MAWKSRSKKRSLKSVVKKTGAISYKVPNSLHLWVDEDRITGSHVTKRKRNEESRDRGGSSGSWWKQRRKHNAYQFFRSDAWRYERNFLTGKTIPLLYGQWAET